jgi:hypothetical protein
LRAIISPQKHVVHLRISIHTHTTYLKALEKEEKQADFQRAAGT